MQEEVAFHHDIESELDHETEAYDRERTLGALSSMRALLEHIGEFYSPPSGTSELTPLTKP